MRSVILRDVAFQDNHVSLVFALENVVIEDGDKIYYFKVKLTFALKSIEIDFAVFESDWDNFEQFTWDKQVNELYFLEPDLSFTVINSEDLMLYVNLDAGLRHSNICTSSGLALRMNITEVAFKTFIKELLALK